MNRASPQRQDTGVYEALQKSNERLRLLAETSASLLLTEEPRELLRTIFDKLAAHLGLEIYFNYLVSDNQPRLHLDSWAGVSIEAAVELEWLDIGEGVCGTVARERRRMVCENIQANGQQLQAAVRAVGVAAYACFPLAAHGRLIGTLSFGSRRRSRFEPDELDLMETVAGHVAAAVDRKLASDELRRQSAELRERAHLLEYAHVFIRDMESTIVFWNKGAEEMYGWTKREALGRKSHDLLRTEFPVPLEAVEEQVLREGTWAGELIHTRRDHSRIVVASHWVLHREENGKPAAILEVDNDITGLRRAEAALRESESRYRTLSETVPVMVFTMLPDGGCDYANQRWYDYTGLTAGQTVGNGWFTPMHPEDLAGTAARWKAALESASPFEAQCRFRRADGSFRRFLCRGLPLRDASGRIVKWFGTCMDVEDQRRVEEAVRRAQKSETIGVLAGGVAHQFNNLLTGIMGGVSFVLETVPEGDPTREVLEGAMTSSQRAAELTAQLLAYAGKGRFVVEPLDISAVVREVVGLLETAVPKKTALRLELGRNLPRVEADAGHLRQVIMSLVMNGAEAIGENPGVVRIGTGTERFEKPARGQFFTGELAPGTYVCLEVEDTGCGMDEATIARIFDPFFTTKFMGRGLGLAAVLGIVRGHGGAIRIRSAPGEGSTFTVLLPAAERKPGTPPQQSSAGTRTVLVVDDEEIVRNTARAILERFGYRVLLAENGQDAISTLAALADEVSLVVLDMAMPVMSGEEALRHLRRIRPDVPVLVASGYDESETNRRFAGQDIVGFIQKPYTSRQLAERVRSILEG